MTQIKYHFVVILQNGSFYDVLKFAYRLTTEGTVPGL